MQKGLSFKCLGQDEAMATLVSSKPCGVVFLFRRALTGSLFSPRQGQDCLVKARIAQPKPGTQVAVERLDSQGLQKARRDAGLSSFLRNNRGARCQASQGEAEPLICPLF